MSKKVNLQAQHMGKLSVKKRHEGKTKAQIKEYYRKLSMLAIGKKKLST